MQDDWLELADAIQELKLTALEAITPMLVWIIERIEDLIFWIQSKTKRGQVIGEATYETIMAVLDEDDDGDEDNTRPWDGSADEIEWNEEVEFDEPFPDDES